VLLNPTAPIIMAVTDWIQKIHTYWTINECAHSVKGEWDYLQTVNLFMNK
jgi:hypothetical protein